MSVSKGSRFEEVIAARTFQLLCGRRGPAVTTWPLIMRWEYYRWLCHGDSRLLFADRPSDRWGSPHMKSSLRLLVSLVLVLTALPLLAAADNGSQARSEHQRIVDFWTPARVAQAVPRDFVLDPESGRVVPAKGKPQGTPGGGNGGSAGGSDGGSTVVSGDSWNGGGEIDGASGKLLFAMDGSYWVCSASVIDDGSSGSNGSAMIITAAHCVYDETNRVFADNWMFIPDYDAAPAPLDTTGSFCESTSYGCWTPEAMAVDSRYASAPSFDAALPYDFGVVRVGPGGKSGEKIELDDVVTEQSYSFSGPVPLDGSVSGDAFGYPAEKKWNGDDLIYCSGPIDGDPYNSDETYRLNECKLNGGSSGGPWLSPFDEATGSGTIISVNSYGYRGVNAMHGPFLNSDTQAVYDAAQGSGGTVGG
jgi:hypothetical protein